MPILIVGISEDTISPIGPLSKLNSRDPKPNAVQHASDTRGQFRMYGKYSENNDNTLSNKQLVKPRRNQLLEHPDVVKLKFYCLVVWGDRRFSGPKFNFSSFSSC
jgi:hypothetical protein